MSGAMDSENVIGWKTDGRAYSGWTSWRAHRDGRAVEADVALYANILDDYRRRGIDAKLELRKTVVHELGHVLGLGHSDQLGDAMIVKVRTRPEWKLPSANDLLRCRALYPDQRSAAKAASVSR
jgi:predicted Zn-dependent protease